jgi:hypothetical protein
VFFSLQPHSASSLAFCLLFLKAGLSLFLPSSRPFIILLALILFSVLDSRAGSHLSNPFAISLLVV